MTFLPFPALNLLDESEYHTGRILCADLYGCVYYPCASSLVILETENPGQYFFIAPTDTVEVSDEHALVTQTFKAAAPGLSARGGIRPGVNADLKNPTVEKAV